MKVPRFALYCCAIFALLAAVNPSPVRVPAAQIDAENARWKAYGVTLPSGGIVLPQPYSPPYSNRSFIVPVSWYEDFRRAAGVRASDLRADLPTLRLLMEKTYAGYSPAARRGWNWNKWFASWDARLAREGNATISMPSAFSSWADLERFQFDAHSGVLGVPPSPSGSSSYVLASAPAGSCSALRTGDGRTLPLSARDAGQQPHEVRAWNGKTFARAWYVSSPLFAGKAASIRCASRNITLAAISQTSSAPPAASYQTLGDGIAYVRMPSFEPAADDAIRKALSQVSGLGKEQVVLLDLRGNNGGAIPLDLFTTWFSGGAVEDAAAAPSRIGTTSCFASALQFNEAQQFLAHVRLPVSPELKQRIQQMVDSAATTAPDACTVKPDVFKAQSDMSSHAFSVTRSGRDQTRVVAIVDDKCANECEILVSMLARLPDTVIAGESTFGALGFAQQGSFVLPHSRVPFRLALSRTDPYGDGRSVEGYGLSVDVLLSTSAAQQRDALVSLARALIKVE